MNNPVNTISHLILILFRIESKKNQGYSFYQHQIHYFSPIKSLHEYQRKDFINP